jgi:hypothetical protein
MKAAANAFAIFIVADAPDYVASMLFAVAVLDGISEG